MECESLNVCHLRQLKLPHANALMHEHVPAHTHASHTHHTHHTHTHTHTHTQPPPHTHTHTQTPPHTHTHTHRPALRGYWCYRWKACRVSTSSMYGSWLETASCCQLTSLAKWESTWALPLRSRTFSTTRAFTPPPSSQNLSRSV